MQNSQYLRLKPQLRILGPVWVYLMHGRNKFRQVSELQILQRDIVQLPLLAVIIYLDGGCAYGPSQ